MTAKIRVFNDLYDLDKPTVNRELEVEIHSRDEAQEAANLAMIEFDGRSAWVECKELNLELYLWAPIRRDHAGSR